jgi:hypothetical protein
LQAVRLTTLSAFKVNVIVMVICGAAGLVAKGIFYTACIIQHFVNKSFVKEGF